MTAVSLNRPQTLPGQPDKFSSPQSRAPPRRPPFAILRTRLLLPIFLLWDFAIWDLELGICRLRPLRLGVRGSAAPGARPNPKSKIKNQKFSGYHPKNVLVPPVNLSP